MKILNEIYFKSKEDLIQVADLLPYPFIVAEIKMDINVSNLYFNQNIVNEFGYSTDEIKNVEDWFLKVYPDENYRNEVRSNFRKELEIARASGSKFVKIKAKLTPKNKKEKWYEIKAFFINDFFVFAFVDINNEVILQEELKRTNQNNDRMLSILGHDLRSPIANLALTSTLALNSYISKKEFKEIVKSINQESHQVLDMLGTTFDWARLNFDDIHVNNVSIDYKALVSGIISAYKTVFEIKKIKVAINLEDFVTSANDFEIITIIIRNLFSNAIKFTPNNGNIRIYSQLNTIVVQDSGVGMPVEKIKKIIDNNYESTRGTNNELGIGMGLQLVMKLAQKINCEIAFESQINVGTSVKLIFK
jgi:signal transduction histidine kinase